MLIFLRKGEPNISVKTMLMKDKNPMPMNSGEPQGNGRGAAMSGHNWKNPSVGRERQSLDPPAQFGPPDDPTSDAPIKRTTVPIRCQIYDEKVQVLLYYGMSKPVIIGGKSLFRVRGDVKARNISRNEQIIDVPIYSGISMISDTRLGSM